MLVTLLTLCYLSTFFLCLPQSSDCQAHGSNGPQVWLTVSSRTRRKSILSTEYIQRELILNWNRIAIIESTWIGLFDRDVESPVDKSDALHALDTIETSEGSFRTKVQFPIHKFQQEPIFSSCLTYHIAYIQGNQVKVKNCIQNQPFWMSESKEYLARKPLSRLMIPGTHNSGSYSIGYEPGLITKAFNAYTLCQDEDVFNQLVYGIRYFDLRVMYRPKNGEDFWIAHDFFPINKSLRTILEQVKDFMDKTQEEVVILDFHRFPVGFEDGGRINVTKHNQLLQMVEQILGQHLAFNTKTYAVTVGELVRSGRRLVIGHAENTLVERDYLFPAAKQIWANSDRTDQIKAYFDQNLCPSDYSGSMVKVAMAELTPEASKLLTYGGLRKMAETINPLVTKWFRDEYQQCGKIVASDYFLGNNVIQLSINYNKKF